MAKISTQISSLSRAEEAEAYKWAYRFMAQARLIAGWSKDPVRKVGALVITPDGRQVSWGYNGFPRGIADDPELLENPKHKNLLMVHAEANAIYNAGFPVVGATLVVTRFPCHECAKAIIQAGIKQVIAPGYTHETSDRRPSWDTAHWMFDQSGVGVLLLAAMP